MHRMAGRSSCGGGGCCCGGGICVSAAAPCRAERLPCCAAEAYELGENKGLSLRCRDGGGLAPDDAPAPGDGKPRGLRFFVTELAEPVSLGVLLGRFVGGSTSVDSAHVGDRLPEALAREAVAQALADEALEELDDAFFGRPTAASVLAAATGGAGIGGGGSIAAGLRRPIPQHPHT